MAKAQVQPLDNPERLQPSGIQRDTFAAPPAPVQDNNAELLSKSLGQFSDSLNSYWRAYQIDQRRQEGEHKKQFLDHAEKEFILWRQQLTDTQFLDAVRRGQAPYQSDRLFSAYVERKWGEAEGAAFGREIQSQLVSPEGARLTASPDWNPDQFMRDQVNRFTQDGRLNFSVHALKGFAGAADAARGEVLQWTAKQDAERNNRAALEAANTTLNQALDAGLESQMTGAQLLDHMREKYLELGPRIKGGALDLRYATIDKMALDVIERRAKGTVDTPGDPRIDKVFREFVNTPRKDPSTGEPISPLVATPDLVDRINEVAKVARTTALNQESEVVKQRVVAELVNSFSARDGSFIAKVDDQPLPNGKTYKMEEAKKAATQAALQAIRQKNGGVNLEDELDYFQRNDVVHPMVAQIDSQVSGSLTSSRSKDGPPEESLQRFIEIAKIYNTANEKNPTQIDKLNSTSRDAMEVYHLLIKGGLTEREAALKTLIGLSTPDTSDAKATREREAREHLDTVFKNVDLNGWDLGGKAGSWFGPIIQNDYQLKQQLINLANNYMRVDGVGAKAATDQAAIHLAARTAFVNGQALFGIRGISKAEEPYIQATIAQAFKVNPDVMKANDVANPDGLTVRALPNGTVFLFNRKTNSPIMDKEGRAISFTSKQIQEAKLQAENAATKAQQDVIIKDHEAARAVWSKPKSSYPTDMPEGTERPRLTPVERAQEAWRNKPAQKAQDAADLKAAQDSVERRLRTNATEAGVRTDDRLAAAQEAHKRAMEQWAAEADVRKSERDRREQWLKELRTQ